MAWMLLLTLAVWSVESGQANGRSGFERLVVVAPDGSVVGVADGSSDRVVINAALDRQLLTPGARLRLIHSHPAGTSLSAADLGHLAKAGLELIEARGEDGSRYRASAPTHDPACIEARLHEVARAAVGRFLRRPSSKADRADFDAHLNHLVALALRRAALLTYSAELGGARAASFARHRVLFGHAIESAAGAVRHAAARCCHRADRYACAPGRSRRPPNSPAS